MAFPEVDQGEKTKSSVRMCGSSKVTQPRMRREILLNKIMQIVKKGKSVQDLLGEAKNKLTNESRKIKNCGVENFLIFVMKDQIIPQTCGIYEVIVNCSRGKGGQYKPNQKKAKW